VEHTFQRAGRLLKAKSGQKKDVGYCHIVSPWCEKKTGELCKAIEKTRIMKDHMMC
jgi:hypothetical protein